MRLILALLVVALGCGKSGATADAGQPPDGSDAPAAQPDAPADSPAAVPDAPAGSDAMGDGVRLDAGGDAGPFSCAAGLTCAADQYCEPQCCSGCYAGDGGCPVGATSCTLGGGASGCDYCTAARCVNTIPFGCNLSVVGGEPRRLICTCG
jgi:hypothetical protein